MVESHPPRAQVGLGRSGTAWPSLRDRTGLAPGAVRYSSGIFGSACRLHEEGILLGGDSIFSGGQRRGGPQYQPPHGGQRARDHHALPHQPSQCR